MMFPEKATYEVMPSREPQKEPRKLEFLFADVMGVWYSAPETWVRMDGSEKKHVEPGQIGLHIKWGAKNYGFGEYIVRFMTDGTIKVHDEYGGPNFSQQLFAFIGEQIAKGEHDRERDAKETKSLAELAKEVEESNEGSGTTQGE